MSPRRIPVVIDDHLVTNTGESHPIEVGSPAWFAWLRSESPSSFSYQTSHGAITIRPEKKRQGWYWYAYHAVEGSLRKSYLGKAESITPERLSGIADTLTRQPGVTEQSPGVQLTFLGAPHLTRSGLPVILTSMKAIGLLAYLSTHDRPQRREYLLALLWPESPITQARKNLRNLLWSIRDLLGPDVVTGHESLALGKHVTVDVGSFTQARREAQQREANGESPFDCYQSMITLYQGSFLDGVSVNDAAEFETWVAMSREHFNEAHAHALRALATNYRVEGRWVDVITLARAAVMQDILQEPMYRMLMEAHARMGDRASALRQYETLRATLDRELGVSPLAETEQLRRDILDGRLQPAPVDDVPESSLLSRTPTDQHLTPFIGRVNEMAALDTYWTTAQQGQAFAALISGEAGQGKSRLWQMWAARLDPKTPVLVTQCLSTTQSLPLAPIADLLRSPMMRRRLLRLAQPVPPVWLEDVVQLVPDVRDELPVIPHALTLPPLEEQRRLFEALVQSLGIRPGHPRVLFFDNLQWADQSTIEWLGYLLHRGHDLPLLFVGAYRPEEASPALMGLIASWMREGVANRLPLARLDHEETTRLISALNGDERRAEELYARSAGNPYFLIELLRAEPGAMPAQLTDLITLRLDQLPGAARQVLQAAALLQPEIDCTLLQHISGRTEEETIEAVETLQQTGLLRDEGQRYAFGHPLIADVVDAEMSRARRMILHRRVADTLERLAGERLTEIAGRLARHFREADNPQRAAYYAELAGDRALTLAAPVEAEQFYEQALALQATTLRYYRLGLARRRQADLEGARAAYIQALRSCEQANEWSWASRICLEMARICLARNQFDDILTWVERARSYLPYDEDPVLPQVLSAYLMGGHLRGTGQSLEAAMAQLNEALLTAIKGNMLELLPGILLELGTVVAHTGETTSAIRCFNELIAIAHTIRDYFHQSLGYHNLASAALQVGDLPMARYAVEEGLKLAHSRAVHLTNQWLYATRGELAMAEQHWDDAESWLTRGLAEAERNDNTVQVAQYRADMGLVARARGQHAQAVTLLEDARSRLTQASARRLLITIDLWLSEIEFERGCPDAAQCALDRAQEQLHGSDYTALHDWAKRQQAALSA